MEIDMNSPNRHLVVAKLSLLSLLLLSTNSFVAADTPKTVLQQTKPKCCSAKLQNYSKVVAKYEIPDLKLLNQAGETVSLHQEFSNDRPVVMQFAFTSCSTICPVASGTLAAVQKKLGADAHRVQFVTISIDPEYDTPEKLDEYARLMKAGESWHFLTGDSYSIARIQKAFSAFVPNKSRHEALTFLRASKSKEWTRVTGLVSAEALTKEVRSLLSDPMND